MTWEQVITITTNLSTIVTVVAATIYRILAMRKSVGEIKRSIDGQGQALSRVEQNFGRRWNDPKPPNRRKTDVLPTDTPVTLEDNT